MKVRCRQAGWLQYHTDLCNTRLKPAYGTEQLKKAIDSGHAKLYEVFCDDVPVGCFICRLEPGELVVMHAISIKPTQVPFTAMIDPLITAIARRCNLPAIRVHTDKRGLDRIVESFGYQFIENVFRKNL